MTARRAIHTPDCSEVIRCQCMVSCGLDVVAAFVGPSLPQWVGHLKRLPIQTQGKLSNHLSLLVQCGSTPHTSRKVPPNRTHRPESPPGGGLFALSLCCVLSVYCWLGGEASPSNNTMVSGRVQLDPWLPPACPRDNTVLTPSIGGQPQAWLDSLAGPDITYTTAAQV